MALGYSNITLQGVNTEWGVAGALPYPGLPKTFSQFYRGGTYVPSNYWTTGNIPTSGNLSGSQFFGTNAEADGATILDAFINAGHITRYFRINNGRFNPSVPGTPGTCAWIGYDSSGKPAVPYRWGDVGSTPISVASYYYNSDLTGYSKYTTTVYVAQGRASINGSTFNGNNLQFTPGNGSSVWIDRYTAISRDLNQASFSWVRGYDSNRFGTGSWGRMMSIPGKWDINQYASLATTDYNAYDGAGNQVYRATLAPGEWCVLFNQDTGYGNGNSLPPYNASVSSVVKCADWWYNTCYSIWAFNNTYSTQNIDYITGYANVDKSGGTFYSYIRAAGAVYAKWQRSY